MPVSKDVQVWIKAGAAYTCCESVLGKAQEGLDVIAWERTKPKDTDIQTCQHQDLLEVSAMSKRTTESGAWLIVGFIVDMVKVTVQVTKQRCWVKSLDEDINLEGQEGSEGISIFGNLNSHGMQEEPREALEHSKVSERVHITEARAKVQAQAEFKQGAGGAIQGSSPGHEPNMNESFGGDSHQGATGHGRTEGNRGSNYGSRGISHGVQKGVGNIIGFVLVYNGADGVNWAIDFEIGRALHAEVHCKDLSLSLVIGNTLISMYGSCGAMAHAMNAYYGLTKPDIVSKTAILSDIIIEQGQDEKALQSYCKLSQEEIGSNHQIFLMALQACGKLPEKEEGCMLKDGEFFKANSLEIGRAIHVDAEARGLDIFLFVANTLISMYKKCGATTEAEIIFEKFSHIDIIAWNKLFAYVEEGKADDVLCLYRQMHEEGFKPNRQTFFTVLQACDDVAIEMSKTLNGNAVKGCAKSLFLSDVGIALHADGEEGQVLSLFNNMQEEGLVRDEIIVVGILQACWKTRQLDIENENKGTCKGKEDNDGTLQNDDNGVDTSKDGEISSCEGYSEREKSESELGRNKSKRLNANSAIL
ncbi:hypothetical protein L7F22_028917 [Adiantum nelumboides]|nr:hypothetical protein [Adiantum nelumboides]